MREKKYQAVIDKRDDKKLFLVEEQQELTFNLPAALLPAAAEGDVVELILRLKQTKTNKKRQEIESLIEEIADNQG